MNVTCERVSELGRGRPAPYVSAVAHCLRTVSLLAFGGNALDHGQLSVSIHDIWVGFLAFDQYRQRLRNPISSDWFCIPIIGFAASNHLYKDILCLNIYWLSFLSVIQTDLIETYVYMLVYKYTHTLACRTQTWLTAQDPDSTDSGVWC